MGRQVGERNEIERRKKEKRKRVILALDFRKFQMKVKAVASCQPIKPDKLELLSRSMLINLRPRPT